MKIGIIYKCTNLTNGKIYIGKTIHKKPRIYFKIHINNALRNRDNNKRIFYKAIRKYGVENFKFEIVEEGILESQLSIREIYYINYYDSYHHGYNMTETSTGGDQGNKKGQTWNEMYGIERATEIRIKHHNTKKTRDYTEANKARSKFSKGKTYEEIYGKENAESLIKTRTERSSLKEFWQNSSEEVLNKAKSIIGNAVSKKRKGHTYEEIHGEEKAKQLKSIKCLLFLGNKNPKAKSYKLINKEGTIYFTDCLTIFCKEHNLSYQILLKFGLKISGPILNIRTRTEISTNTCGWQIIPLTKEEINDPN